jgi:hypothetical protein
MTNSGNIILMGYLNYGSQGQPVYDNHGIFQDTINYPKDSNKLFLYELDNSGNINWQKSLNNIFDNYSEYFGDRNIVYNNSYIVVGMPRDILVFDHQGNELKRFIPISPWCNNEILSISKTENDNIYVSGSYFWKNDTLQTYTKYLYFSKININNNEIWKKDMQGNLTYLSNNAVAIHSDTIGSVYDNSGNLLYSSNYLKTNCISKTCNNGYISVLCDYYANKITVIKSTITGN